MKHLPSWANKVWCEANIDLWNTLEYHYDYFNDSETNYCMVSQLVAEYLELNKIYWDKTNGFYYKVKDYPIKFFTDEV